MKRVADLGRVRQAATLVDVFRHWVQIQPDRVAVSFLSDGESLQQPLTYAELDQRARAIAAHLLDRGATGQPAILVYPPGLDFITAFFGCLYAGVIAIPAEMPHARRSPRRIAGILEDVQPSIVLTTAEYSQRIAAILGEQGAGKIAGSGVAGPHCVATDEIDSTKPIEAGFPTLGPRSLCMLQYTSGSTRTPRGVMVSHRNLLANLSMIQHCLDVTFDSHACCWLPHFHDMGLIGILLEAVFAGCSTTMLAPAAFLQHPIRWLKTVSNVRATHSGGPNFAFELCATRIDPAACEGLDLSCWRIAPIGAERVRPETLARFSAKFAGCGFQPAAFSPCYGLAESTLLVTGLPGTNYPQIGAFDEGGLRSGQVRPAINKGFPLVSCGPPAPGSRVIIVDPDSKQRRPPDQVGEIWVAGPHVATGYWNRQAESAEVFHARLAPPQTDSASTEPASSSSEIRVAAQDDDSDRFLRTGDLGFLYQGTLYITGRAKELIIVHGQNHYPQDIEATVSQAHSALSLLWSAAFAVEVDGLERLVVVHELTREGCRADVDQVVAAVRAVVSDHHELQLYALVLVEPGTIPKTTSGKVQRLLCRQKFIDQELSVVREWIEVPAPDSKQPQATGAAANRNEVRDWLVAVIASRLNLSQAAVDPFVPMAQFGLDSVAIVALGGELELWLGRKLSPTLLYEYPTIDTLSTFLATPEPSEQKQIREVSTHRLQEPIAVIGVACRFPGADGPEAFWNLLRTGTDAVRDAPRRDWLDDLTDSDLAIPQQGGFLDDVDLFDARFFGIAPREAVLMDPQQRLLLETAWESFTDAGIAASQLAGSRTSVSIGISTGEYAWATLANAKTVDLHAGTGGALSIAANRLSYQFDLRGPSLAVDTACSSSLVAVHLACRSLWDGGSDLALAGGVNLILSRNVTAAFAKARFLAPDGRCKAFDASANGYVRGEGVGLIVLKPLSKALAAGDPIRAVIRGGAINQNGRSNGLTAPNPRAQADVLRAAYQSAGIDPADVDYIEAHGTGTALGDPIEARALGEFLAAAGKRQPCAVGTVKSNCGHLEAAAGIAGLIKVVLMLEHGELPPSLHFHQPNPLIPFDQLPLRVQQQHSTWPQKSGPRLAGVSSFGFGGTNAHIVLISSPEPRPTSRSTPRHRWQRERFWIAQRTAREEPGGEAVHVPATPVHVPVPSTATAEIGPPKVRRAPILGSPENQRHSLEQFVRHSVAEVLGLQESEIDIARPLIELGLDSLMAVDLVQLAERELQVRIPFESLLRNASVTSVVVDLLQRIGAVVQQVSIPDVAADSEMSGATLGQPSSIPRMPRGGELPLSFSQRRLWLLDQLAEDTCLLNIPAAVRLQGRLDVSALEQALTRLIERHEALRTVIGTNTDRVFQVIRPPQPLVLHVLQLSPLPPGELESESLRLLTAEARQRLEPADGPLLKVTLLRLNHSQHDLLLTFSHLISDGWSIGIIVRELAELYSAIVASRAPQLAELPIQLADFAHWQRTAISAERKSELQQYWRQRLGPVLPVLDMPADHPRPAVTTFRGARRWFELPGELADGVLELSRFSGVTPFMTLLAALKILLFRCSGQSDVLIGTPSAGRTRHETENLVGALLNPLPLLTSLSGDPSVRELLHRVRDTALGAYAHQDLPFEEIVAEWHQHTDVSHPPVFQYLFDLQEIGRAPFEVPGLVGIRLPIDPGTAMVDLSLYLTKEPGSLHGYFEFNTDLFEPETIDLLIGRLRTLLADMVAAPDRRVSELTVLPYDERHRLVTDYNRTEIGFARDQCLHERIEQQVAHTPDAIALVRGDQQLTYAELDRKANQLAWQLRKLGVRPPPAISATTSVPGLIGLCVERSLDMVVGMLGVLKAGAAYVPMDPRFPVSRRALMLEDSRAQVVLTQRHLADGWPSGVSVVCLDELNELDDAGDQIKPVVEPPLAASNIAYVLYTSGSTGLPKGVMVTHRNLVNFCAAMDALHGDEPPGVWLAVTSMSFDISMLELLWTLTRGFRVVIQTDLIAARPAQPHQEIVEASTRPGMQFSLFYFECDEQQTGGDKYRLVLDGARFADQHGFTAVWTPERHFHPFGGLYPNPAVIAAAVAAATQRIRVRAGSVVLPLHDPLRVAEEWSVVDNLSHGRVDVSFAPGSHPNDFVFAPDRYADRKDWMLREIDTVRRLWRGESLRRPGGSGQEVEVRVFPRPIQPELPCWLTAIGSESFALAGQRGFHVLTHLLFQDPQELAAKIHLYRDAWRSAGHPGNGHVTLMVHTFVGDDLRRVRELLRRPLSGYLRSSADMFIKLGLASKFGVASEHFTPDDLEAFVERGFERFFEFNGLLGTPEICLEVIERLEAIRVDEVACLIDFGLPFDQVLGGLQRLRLVKEANDRRRQRTEPPCDDPSIVASIRAQRVTHLQCTPAAARMILAEPDAEAALRGLRRMYVGGEALPTSLARQLRDILHGQLWNMYGPTETTIWSTVETNCMNGGSVPIGRPIANTRLYVLDGQGNPVPRGVAGELFIGGEGVARGYFQRPELTAERFQPDRFCDEPGARMYRTGDLVRYRYDGRLEFLGRLDHQVKVRGHRIELGEIETHLSRIARVGEAVVVARTDPSGEKQLVAYVVPAGEVPIAEELRDELARRLPRYMLPTSFHFLNAFPLTPNGKVDRGALVARPFGETPTATTASPARAETGSSKEFVKAVLTAAETVRPGIAGYRTPTERALALLWRGVLELEQRVGIYDNFFALGGHSLHAAMVVSRIHDMFQVKLPLRIFFAAPHLAALAEAIDAARASGEVMIPGNPQAVQPAG